MLSLRLQPKARVLPAPRLLTRTALMRATTLSGPLPQNDGAEPQTPYRLGVSVNDSTGLPSRPVMVTVSASLVALTVAS